MFCLASAGLTVLVVRSSFLKPLREKTTQAYKYCKDRNIYIIKQVLWFFNEILNCELCFSFWGGMVTAILLYDECSYDLILFGFISSGFVYLYISITSFLKP